jgi:hypothetical protein
MCQPEILNIHDLFYFTAAAMPPAQMQLRLSHERIAVRSDSCVTDLMPHTIQHNGRTPSCQL